MGFLSRLDPRARLRYVLIFQFVIAGFLVASDVSGFVSVPFRERVELPT